MHRLSKRLMPKYNELFSDNQIDYNKVPLNDILNFSLVDMGRGLCKPLSEYSKENEKDLKEFGELYKIRNYVLGLDQIMPEIIREFKDA